MVLAGLALVVAGFVILQALPHQNGLTNARGPLAPATLRPLAGTVNAVKAGAAAVVNSMAPGVTGTHASNASDPKLLQDRDEHRPLAARDPRGLAAELHSRGETDVSGSYAAGKESYELFLPTAALAGVPHGVLVWISSDPSGAIPNGGWRSVLAAHRLVWVGANQAGNQREVALRVGLSLDALQDSRQHFTLDEKRVYIGGVSGGAKSAFRALLFHPEVFQGAVLAAGIEYFRPLAAKSRGQGAQWPERIGLPRNLQLAKTRPIALTTGPTDFNFGQINDVVAGAHEDNFVRMQIFSWQELGHAPPPAELLDRVLVWLNAP